MYRDTTACAEVATDATFAVANSGVHALRVSGLTVIDSVFSHVGDDSELLPVNPKSTTQLADNALHLREIGTSTKREGPLCTGSNIHAIVHRHARAPQPVSFSPCARGPARAVGVSHVASRDACPAAGSAAALPTGRAPHSLLVLFRSWQLSMTRAVIDFSASCSHLRGS